MAKGEFARPVRVAPSGDPWSLACSTFCISASERCKVMLESFHDTSDSSPTSIDVRFWVTKKGVLDT